MINPWTWYILNNEMPDLGESKYALLAVCLWFILSAIFATIVGLFSHFFLSLGFGWWAVFFFLCLFVYIFMFIFLFERFADKLDKKDEKKSKN